MIAPIQEYSHLPGKNSGYCVTGGIVYHGKQFPQLAGAYVFADYASGNIWTLRYDGPSTFPFEWIANDNTISAFGLDPRNDELLMTDHVDGTIKRLMYTTTVAGTPLPATLADTGAFSDLTSLTPSPGIVAYDINVPFWSDNAQKTRWFSVPNTNLTLGFNPEGNWSFPTGTVWIKHFDLELTNGLPESRRRLAGRFTSRWSGARAG